MPFWGFKRIPVKPIYFRPFIGWMVATQAFFYFHPEPWGFMIQFDEHIFQMGWFNHQLLQDLSNILQPLKSFLREKICAVKDSHTNPEIRSNSSGILKEPRISVFKARYLLQTIIKTWNKKTVKPIYFRPFMGVVYPIYIVGAHLVGLPLLLTENSCGDAREISTKLAPQQKHFKMGCFSWMLSNLFLEKWVVSPNMHLKKWLFRVPGRRKNGPFLLVFFHAPKWLSELL